MSIVMSSLLTDDFFGFAKNLRKKGLHVRDNSPPF